MMRLLFLILNLLQILAYNSDPYLLGKKSLMLQYDLIAKGNAGAFKLIGGWFDGDGAFIATRYC